MINNATKIFLGIAIMSVSNGMNAAENFDYKSNNSGLSLLAAAAQQQRPRPIMVNRLILATGPTQLNPQAATHVLNNLPAGVFTHMLVLVPVPNAVPTAQLPVNNGAPNTHQQNQLQAGSNGSNNVGS